MILKMVGLRKIGAIIFLLSTGCGGSYSLSLGPNHYGSEEQVEMGKIMKEHCTQAKSVCSDAASLCKSSGDSKDE